MTSSMRTSIIAVLFFAAAALGIIVYNKMQQPQQIAQNVPPPLMISYFVAAHPLPPGTLARQEDFATRSAPSASLPPMAIVDSPDAKTSLRGSLVRRFLDTGTAVTPDDVLRPRDRGFLASVLASDTRAISINVDAASGVAGLIWPGDHVDVVLTHDIEQANLAQHTVSETILQDVRIIAIDQEIVQGAPADNAAAGKVAHTVTLQVAPDQVEMITVAQQLGKLSLAMRSAAEVRNVIPSRSMYSGDVSPALTEQGATVMVYEGDKAKQWSFKKGGS